MRFTRSNGTAPWRVHCENFGTSAAAAIVDTKTGKKVAFAVDQIALGFPDSYLNLSHGDLMLDALNVHEATGLTPSQLQARVAELEAALAKAQKLAKYDQYDLPDAEGGQEQAWRDGYQSAVDDLREALA